MGLLQKIKTLIHNRKDPKRIFIGSKHIIEHAFTIAGVDYYQFADTFNVPYERGLMALAVYEETRMKCSKEYLEKHVKAVREVLHGSETINVFRIEQLNEQLNERLELVCDTDLLYKLASVAFFDENENPATYEPEYADKKIAFWKQHKGVADFFFQKPLIELIPFLRSADFDLNTYSQLSRELNKIHLERLQLFSSKS
jgi:hypothetical protein